MVDRSSSFLVTPFLLIALTALLGCGGPPDLATMVEEVRAGVVRIETSGGSGSGFIFDTGPEDSALVLTNYHVVDSAGRVRVIVDDAITYRGHIQGFDAANDLAALSICCGDFKTLSFGDVSDLRPGSEVVAVGYPFDIPGAASVTRGIVSAIRSQGRSEIIQMDAPINPGNSGGPLLSLTGEVMGVNTFVFRDGEGLGFAVSAKTVRAVLPELEGERILAIAATPTPTPRPTATPRPRPTPLPTATPIPLDNCGYRSDGTLECWSPTATPRPGPTATPTPMDEPEFIPWPPPETVTAIGLGVWHACALRPDGTPVCWGLNNEGRATPPVGENFITIGVGAGHTCGLRFDGTPVCWGLNNEGQATPPSDEKFTAISVDDHVSCGLRLDGTPICWGSNEWGEATPPADERFTAISVGSHSCGLRLDGTPICWGSNEWGEATPPAGEKFAAISVGVRFSCGLRFDGTPVCWGHESEGEAMPPAGEKFTTISVGWPHVCGLRQDGTPVCWGNSLLDDGSLRPPEDEKFATIICGGLGFTCGLRPDGWPVCWGPP